MPEENTRKLKLYLLSILLFSLIFAAVFVAAELLIRYSVMKDATESRDHVVEADYSPARFKPHHRAVLWGIPFKTNHYGFRDEEDFGKTPEHDQYRILSLGDSIGFGVGIPARSHYTQVAERYLNQQHTGRAFHIINAAGQGYSPSGYYVYLRHEGLELHPDMVIVDMEMCSVVTNEALLHWIKDPDNPAVPIALEGGRYVVGWDGNLLLTYSLGTYFFEKTYVYTILLRRFLNLMYGLFPTQPFSSQNQNGCCYYNIGFDKYLLDEDRLESGWNKTFGVLGGTHELLQKNGIPFLLMIFPSRYVFEEGSGVWRTFAEEALERGIRRAQQHGIPHLVLKDPIGKAGGASLYFDFAHLTEEGNQAVGEALAEYLAARLGQPAVSGEQ